MEKNPYHEGTDIHAAFEEMRQEYPNWVLVAINKMTKHGLLVDDQYQIDEAATYIMNAYEERNT